MDRMACVDLPAFPLQLLLRRHPDWREHPVAVVDCDKPQGKILWVNERARAQRILPGMRYAAALSLAARLRAAGGAAEGDRRRRSPRWSSGCGASRRRSSLRRRARRLLARRLGAGAAPRFPAQLGRPGPRRPGAGRLPRHRGGRLHPLRHLRRWPGPSAACSSCETPADERAAARRVPLDRLAIAARRRAMRWRKLGVTTRRPVRRSCPPRASSKRFGPEVLPPAPARRRRAARAAAARHDRAARDAAPGPGPPRDRRAAPDGGDRAVAPPAARDAGRAGRVP